MSFAGCACGLTGICNNCNIRTIDIITDGIESTNSYDYGFPYGSSLFQNNPPSLFQSRFQSEPSLFQHGFFAQDDPYYVDEESMQPLEQNEEPVLEPVSDSDEETVFRGVRTKVKLISVISTDITDF